VGDKSLARFVEVAKISEISESGVMAVEVEGTTVALVRLQGAVYALADSCPHEGGPLSDGEILGEDIECPWHHSCFNVKTGRVTRDPATEDVATYKVRIVGDVVEIEI
jgi:3-phenylpropionate/trans-cinnamate dioxygenase ferredoxin component